MAPGKTSESVSKSILDHNAARNIQLASFMLMGSIFLSRIIGLLREWVLAQTVGATSGTDVYYASFTIPDFLNYLMATGALSISFIPIIAAYLSAKRKDHVEQLFRSLSTWACLILFFFIILLAFFAKPLAWLVAPGFTPSQIDLLVDLVRVILPAQLLFYWGGLAIAVQQACGVFIYSALAPIIYNLGIIIFGVLFHREFGVMGFSIGVTVGCFFSHGVLQWYGLRKLGISIRPSLKLSAEIRSDIKKYILLILPVMAGFSVVVADEWIARFFASSLGERSISWLSYARMEMRIPMAILGQAAGMASFPYLAGLWASKEYEKYAATLLREIQKLIALAPLAAIVFFDHALPVTFFIYGGSKFSSTDLVNTASALQLFSLGIFFWTLQIVLARAFYACQKNWIPPLLGTLVCILSLPLYRYWAHTLGYMGLALASSVAVGILCVGLGISLKWHLRKFCPQLSFKSFYTFSGLWLGVILLAKWVSTWVLHLGVFKGDRLSALWDILLVTVVLGLMAWVLLRTVFVRYTEGKPLY